MGDVYRVATAGYGHPGSSKLGFVQYNLEGMSEWVLPTLPEIWNDFAGKEKGAILTIWDVTRLTWLAQPKQSELLAKYPGLREWLLNRPFQLWGYVPLDASGPNDRLTFPLMKTLLGFDRILAYGRFGEGVIRRTLSDEEADKRHLTHLPHGIDDDIFYEEDRQLCRKMFLKITGAMPIFGEPRPIGDDEALVAIVGTNQLRKDWALGLEACAILAQKKRIRVWIHIDALERYWSLPCLLIDYGLVDNSLISLGCVSDERMAQAYSAADVTLGIGAEGFGYSHVESQACGTPVVTGSYAGGAEIVTPRMRVDPIAFRYDGMWASRRPVFNPCDWAERAERWIGLRVKMDRQYAWNNLWKDKWEPYLREAATTL
jgi:glycosyltransferase involved in cell wall biosynthesis